MGQKTHPYGFRLGYNKPWKSRWYADRDYADLLHEDVKLRKELNAVVLFDRIARVGANAVSDLRTHYRKRIDVRTSVFQKLRAGHLLGQHFHQL